MTVRTYRRIGPDNNEMHLTRAAQPMDAPR